MFTRSSRCLIAAAASLAAASGVLAQQEAAELESPGLGIEATPEQIAGWDISVLPDGTGLPDGSGTANEGEAIFAAQCALCHGERGGGLLNDRLVGGHGTLSGPSPVKTLGSYWPYATTIFDYVRRAMPYLQPHSLSDDDAYALTAYLLYLNEIIDADDVIDAETLPEVEMPNRDNFIVVYPDGGRP